jgi:hypothetical protein
VTGNTLIEASVGKDTEGSGKMLLPIESLLFKASELGVFADLQKPAILGPAE